MTSITRWNRIEPRVRDPSLPGLEARLADPLWLLARQWQLGEFTGEDAGSPIAARIEAHVGMLSRLASGVVSGRIDGPHYDPHNQPLEAVVEREPVLQARSRNVRLAGEAGLAWWRALDAVDLTHRREDYLLHWAIRPLTDDERATLDDTTARRADLLAGRVPDGVRLRDAFVDVRARGGERPAAPRYDEGWERVAVRKAIDAFLAWWAALDDDAADADPQSCWAGSRLEYQFTTSGVVDGHELVLTAPEYTGGALDWSTFDIGSSSASLMADGLDDDSSALMRTALPAPAAYRGMPAPRYWELEDAAVSFGAIDAGREDLNRLLLTDFALLYGNDFFVVGLDLAVGALCRIDKIVVTDTFGGRWRIASVEKLDGTGGHFHLFRQTGDANPDGLFVLAPSLASRLVGPDLEEVAFVRDDTAAVAWAIERTVLGPGGVPMHRRESEAELRERLRRADREAGTTPIRQAEQPLRYRLAELPPAYWLPLVPAKTGVNSYDLQLRALLDDEDPLQPILPQGRIVRNGDLIRDEEVPRTGISVVRAYRQARWRDGSSRLWIGRSRRLSQDEGPSGLTFDATE